VSTIKYKIRVVLKRHLEKIGITPYMLGKWMDNVSSQTIYAVATETRRPSFEVLELILTELNHHGYPTTLDDLVQVEIIPQTDDEAT
jgi:hypothetical protein